MFKINALKVMRALEVDAPFSDGVTHVDLLLFWVGTLILCVFISFILSCFQFATSLYRGVKVNFRVITSKYFNI